MPDSDPQAAANAFIREVWGLQGAAYVVLAMRYVAHLIFKNRFAWDDVLMLLATLVYTAESVAAYYVVAFWKGLANNGMTPEQREALDPSSLEWELRVNGSKTHVIGLLLYTTVLWLLKGCWVVYYMRLTDGVRDKQRIVFWAAIIMPATYVSCLLVAFLKCIPFDKQWQIYPEPPNSCMPAVSFIQTIYVMVMNTITDFYLMAIPLPMIYKANLPLGKNLSLLVMFSGGLLEMAFGILRAVSILTVGDSDPAQSGYWSVRESFVSFVLTNMPMVYPLFKRFIERSISAASRSENTNALSGSQGYRLGSFHRDGSHPLSKRNKNSNIDPTIETVGGPGEWGSSEECIVEDNKNKGTGPSVSGEELSLQGSDDLDRGPRRRTDIGQYGTGDGVPANVSTTIQGPGGASKGKDAPWRTRNGEIMVTTEISVGGEGGHRRAEDGHLGSR
ncbi:related to integral membrane protein PTH11 [Cephalotrichum gorgonifer]|uniref:Related to integral membrane protein PTH11 n=1 Tax=Cephalotrichum gorgonifer TaxID=2041049 RepID=A0AAE8SSH3_9PEZI|nr:related to integral membrane protein PTH11 [Cephalotrichum gorgonifer]